MLVDEVPECLRGSRGVREGLRSRGRAGLLALQSGFADFTDEICSKLVENSFRRRRKGCGLIAFESCEHAFPRKKSSTS